MPKITFVEFTGQEHTVDATEGESLMEAALNNMVPGIIGDCGGNCACATCHIYLDPIEGASISEASETEQSLLEGGLYPENNSRLACQVQVVPEMDGIIIRLPKSQS